MATDQDRSTLQAQHEAIGSTIDHTGAAADRYESVLVRYVSAVAGEDLGAQHDEPAFSAAFAPWIIGDVMTRATVHASESTPFKMIALALERNQISALPVIDDERKVVGVVTVSDLLTRIAGSTGAGPHGRRLTSRGAAQRKRDGVTAGELMTSPAVTTTQTATVTDAARLAARARVRTLPVVDDSGILIGVVTRGDLIKVFARTDADILRDVERGVLATTHESPHGTVDVEVSAGIVTLSGKVPTARMARRLVHAAHRVNGVVDVADKLAFDHGDSFMALNQGH